MTIMTTTDTTNTAQPIISIRHDDESIALNRLVPSAANVRRLNATAGLSELADSIEAHGLIHKLTVRKGKKGKYEVIAGSRRLGALRLLAKEGRLAADAPIPCTLRSGDDATELSLAENVQREAMHIVDEILGYRELAEGGMVPESIAARFGQSVITVRQRLKLAHLSPQILEVMRTDEMSVEQARALALSDSHDEQVRVWFDAPSYNRDPRSLRAMLSYEANFFHGRNCHAQQHFERARGFYERTIALKPDDYRAWDQLRAVQVSLRLHQEAMQSALECLRLMEREVAEHPDQPILLCYGGCLLADLGEVDKGTLWASRAAAIAGDDLRVLYNLACCYSKLGKIPEAIACLERQTEGSPAYLTSVAAWMKSDSDLDPLRQHQGFMVLAERMQALAV